MLTRRSENATVTVCHTGTRDLAAHVRTGDIVVAAAGSPGLVTAEMVRPGAAVLDAGVSRVDGKIVGDVAPGVAEVAGWLSPNPGGVGPMTRAMLLVNVVDRRRAAGRRSAVTMASSRQGGGRQQLPFAVVLAGLAASFVYLLLEPGHWERGTGAIAASVLLAAAFRALLPTRHVGSLAVRSRWLDTRHVRRRRAA